MLSRSNQIAITQILYTTQRVQLWFKMFGLIQVLRGILISYQERHGINFAVTMVPTGRVEKIQGLFKYNSEEATSCGGIPRGKSFQSDTK